MKVYEEISLEDFEWWSGAVDVAKKLDSSDFRKIEEALEEMYPDGMSKTDVNDFLWFETDEVERIVRHSIFEEDEPDEDEEEDDE